MPESLPFPPSLSSTVPGEIPLSSETWALLPREVQALLLSQNHRILALENALQALQHRLDQDSSNSSKPPSSDSPKAKAKGKRRSPKTPSGKKPGAQPGHPGAQRALLPPDQVSSSSDCFPDRCHACHASLDGRPPAGAPVRRQVYELPEIRPLLLEYRLFPVRCTCGCITTASPPPEAQTGLGVRATALVALLVGRFRLSRSQVAEIFTEQLHIPLSKGAVQTACLRVSHALAAVVDPLMKALLEAWSLHIDETGWKQGKARRWLWVFVASAFTVFVVHARRGRQVLAELGLDTESCRQQHREVMGVLESALRAAQSGLPPPSLLPPERCPQQQAA